MTPAATRARAAAPFGVNAGLALVSVAGALYLPEKFGRVPGQLLGLQLLVVHAIALLYAMILFRRDMLAKGKKFPEYLPWIFVAIYTAAALDMNGIVGLIEFALLASGTFLGAWRGEQTLGEALEVGARWVVAFFALLILAHLFGMPKEVNRWPGTSRSIWFAGTYFGMQALLELTGAYRRVAASVLLHHERERRRRQPPAG
jgi:hypothetical protein